MNGKSIGNHIITFVKLHTLFLSTYLGELLMNSIWKEQIFDNTIKDWAIALSIMVILMGLLRIFQFVVIKRIKKYALYTKNTFDDFFIVQLQSLGMPLLYMMAFYTGLKYVDLPQKPAQVVHIGLLIFILFFILRIINSFLFYSFKIAISRKEKNEQREKQAKGILSIIQVIVWLLGILFLIDNLGYDITTLVAGLGIGGIAIALAAQTILGDLFSYLVIFFDKPFETGDFIVIQDKMGTVEYIGIKTTRLRTLNGEQLICSNTDLTNSRVHNYKRMQERRIVFSFGVVYNTPPAKLKNIPLMIKNIIDDLDLVRYDRAHFLSFGDSSLNFEVVYYVNSPEYNLYMDKQQAINLDIMEMFEREQIEFAFPTQTIFVSKVYHEEIQAS